MPPLAAPKKTLSISLLICLMHGSNDRATSSFDYNLQLFMVECGIFRHSGQVEAAKSTGRVQSIHICGRVREGTTIGVLY